METRITKKSRFQIVKLEERVAPTGCYVPPCASATASAGALACGKYVETHTSTCATAVVSCHSATAYSASTSCAAAIG